MKLFYITYLLSTILVFSQDYYIKGKVLDSNKNSLELIEVNLLKGDSIYYSEFTNNQGEFYFKNINGEFDLEIIDLNTSIFTKKILVDRDLDLGIITIENTINLNEATVLARKKLIEKKVDRLVFNVENSISAIGGDGLDALRVTPSLIVKDDKILIVGKGTVSIMIDDRLIQLTNEDLITFLKSIKSDDIKSIEVITNPPAKYSAEGNGGLINIKLKKIKKNFISGNIKNSYTQAKYSFGSWGGSINYQKDKLTFTSNINYNNGSSAPYQEYTRYYPDYKWFEINNKRNFQNSFGGVATIDYQINSKTNIGLQYSGIYAKPLNEGKNISYITNRNHVLDSLIITPSRLEMERDIHSLNFHSTTKIDSIGSKYSIDVDYFGSSSYFKNFFSSNSYYPNYIPIAQRYLSAENVSDQNMDIYSAKIDYELSLKWLNLSFGGKISIIKNDSKVSYFDTTDMLYVFDPLKSNIFNYKENTQALYISGNKKISKNWDLQLGMRLENTQTKSNSETLNQKNKDSYIKFFPTFYLTYKVTENTTLGLNYSRRVTRPTYRNLNPFRFYSSAYNYSSGNPFLHPFYTDDIEVSFMHKNYFSSLAINYLKNGIDQVALVYENNPERKVIPYNFYNQISIGMTHNYTFYLWKFIESNNMMNINYRKTSSGLSEATMPNPKKITIYFISTNSIFLNNKKTLKAELNFNYLSPSVEGSYKTTSWYYVDVGIRYLLLNNKLQLSLNAKDIFKTFKTTYIQEVNNIEQKTYDYRDSQKIGLSLIWSFGKKIKTDKRKRSNEEEKERI